MPANRNEMMAVDAGYKKATGLKRPKAAAYIGSENIAPAASMNRRAVPYAALPQAANGACTRQPWTGCGSTEPLRDLSNLGVWPPTGVEVARATGPRTHAERELAQVGVKRPASRSPPVDKVDFEEQRYGPNEVASEYVTSIFNVLLKKEARLAFYMDQQPEVNSKMRTILIDWLIEVQAKFKHSMETLFLTVNLLDRYLSKVKVERKRLQLVGVVAMFVAAKFEEVDPPRAATLAYITDNAYTVEDVFNMECHFLQTLGFQVLVPTAASFWDRLHLLNQSNEFQKYLAQYILEFSLLDHTMIGHKPSVLASAAVVASNRILDRVPVWPSICERSTHLNVATLNPVVEELLSHLRKVAKAPQQQLHNKFAKKEFREVSRWAASAAI